MIGTRETYVNQKLYRFSHTDVQDQLGDAALCVYRIAPTRISSPRLKYREGAIRCCCCRVRDDVVGAGISAKPLSQLEIKIMLEQGVIPLLRLLDQIGSRHRSESHGEVVPYMLSIRIE